ncbi:MAG TPA: glycoside hydrolase family 43 protein [Candidatus Saccharimonadales bacterium]|nr:glycoside hydrolase family 43 protein [Candidatus Saccharimonadales bacterium]
MRKEGGPLGRARRYLTETNALLGQDPFVVRHDDSNLLFQSGRGDRSITVRRFETPEEMLKSKPVTLWTPDKKSDHRFELWAPEAHNLLNSEGKPRWYIPYAASDGENENHRKYVLESETADPLGPYHEVGRPADQHNDHWAIDMTYLQQGNDLYAIWSGTKDDSSLLPQNLYIAEMSDPWTISGKRQMISTPDHAWERTIAPINEGPQVLKNGDQTFLVYSADASWANPGYKLGLLEYTGGDVMNPASWVKHPEPVLDKGGAGHASFVRTDSGENVIYLHRKLSTDNSWRDRVIEHDVFNFDQATGRPVFQAPTSKVVSLPRLQVVTGFPQVA